MTHHINKAKFQFPYIALGILFFIVVGWFSPYTYYEHIDKTVYYRIHSVQIEKKEYGFCEPLILRVQRTSLIDTTGEVTINLYKKNDGGIIYDHTQFQSPISKGEKDFEEGTLTTPCKSIPEGEYFYEGIIRYKVDRVTKTEVFHTESFLIKGEKNEAGESARLRDIKGFKI